MRTVLLIHPDVGFCLQKYLVRPVIPYGILEVGTALHNAGYRVQLLDQRIGRDWEVKLEEALTHEIACIGISTMTGGQIKHGLEIAQFVRTHSNKPIIWGGVHPTLLPEQTLENEFVDIVVRGEGEETMLELAHALRDDRPLSGIRGISYKENGSIVHNPDRPFMDLNEQPTPHWDLLNMHDYITEQNGSRSLNVWASRGCPFNCGYCYVKAFHKRKWRAMSLENVTERIVALKERYGINRVFFEDEEFLLNLKRGVELLNRLKTLNIRWSASARIDTILKMDSALLELLEQSGCTHLGLGAESGSNRVLKLMNKGITKEDTLEVNRRLARYNIYARFNFMMGLPTETLEEVGETAALATELKRENKRARVSSFSIFTPYPGTDLHDLAMAHGAISPSRLEDWAGSWLSADNAAWMTKDTQRSMRMLAFATPFLNDPVDTCPPLHVKLLGLAYRPIARLRIAHRFFRFPLEISLAKWLRLYDGTA